MRILAFLPDSASVQSILRHLDLPAHPLDLSPARSPPQATSDFDPEPPLDLDQTPPFDPVGPEPVPEIDFDQSGLLRAEPCPAVMRPPFIPSSEPREQGLRVRS